MLLPNRYIAPFMVKPENNKQRIFKISNHKKLAFKNSPKKPKVFKIVLEKCYWPKKQIRFFLAYQKFWFRKKRFTEGICTQCQKAPKVPFLTGFVRFFQKCATFNAKAFEKEVGLVFLTNLGYKLLSNYQNLFFTEKSDVSYLALTAVGDFICNYTDSTRLNNYKRVYVGLSFKNISQNVQCTGTDIYQILCLVNKKFNLNFSLRKICKIFAAELNCYAKKTKKEPAFFEKLKVRHPGYFQSLKTPFKKVEKLMCNPHNTFNEEISIRYPRVAKILRKDLADYNNKYQN